MRELRSEDIRGFRALENELQQCENTNDFESVSEERLPRLIAAEFHNINTFSSDMTVFQSIRCTHGYTKMSISLMDSFQEAFVSHPMMVSLGVPTGLSVLMQDGACLSDFASDRQFRSSAIYDAVYKPLDTNYQLLIGIGLDHEHTRILGVNRKTSDFSDRERQQVRLTAAALRAGFSSMRDRQQLNAVIAALASVWGIEPDLLSVSELRLLSELISLKSATTIARVRGVRRDTVDRQLAVIRRKLKVGTTNELLSLFLIQGP